MNFNEGQQKFLDHEGGYCLVSAAAGSGKTATLVEKVRRMVQEQGINPNEIMVITFTRNAADELVSRLEKLGVSGIQCGTFHSICGRILSRLKMFGGEVKKYEVNNIFSKIILDEKPNFDEVWSWISYQKNFGHTPDSEEFEPKSLEHTDIGTAKRCFKAYEKYKEDKHLMDMDDVLTRTLKLLEEDKDGYLDRFKFDYTIVDECLSGEQFVKTNEGTKQIRTLYDMYSNNKELPLILSYNIENDIYEYKPMLYAHKSTNRDIYEVKTEGLSKIRCTDNHKLLTQRGYVEVKDIIVGKDIVLMDRTENQKTKLMLNEEQLQIVLGSFLGDGYLQKMSCFNTYRLNFTQGEKQFEYFNQKTKAFNIGYRKIKSGYTGKENVYQSNTTRVFVLHDDIWSILENEISPLGLAIWYQDDGSLSSERYVRLYSEAFTYEENEKLIKILNKRFNIKAEIKTDKKYYFLQMDYENSNKFLSLVSPFMHKSMQYKTTIDITNNNIEFNNKYKNYGGDIVSSIELVDKGDVYDITVKDNHNFITTRTRKCSTVTEGSGMIVHNCQDCNIVQHKLIDNLCRTDNVYIIGDNKQSIYQFNGSFPQAFIGFKDKHEGCKVIDFNINYRSCKNIVEHSNTFCHNYLMSDIYTDAVANNQNDGVITNDFFYTYEDEAKSVAQKIKRLIDSGEKPNDIAVLFRLNEMSQRVELELKQLEIPYFVDSTSSFFKIKEIDAIMCCLRLIQNINDDLAYEQVFNSRLGDFKYMPANLIKTIKSEANMYQLSYIEASENVQTSKKYISNNLIKFSNNIYELSKEKDKLTLKELINEIIYILNIESCIKTNIYYNDEQIDSRLNSLNVLKEFVKGNKSIDSLLTFAYSDQKKKKKTDADKEAVQLMTIHKSKGLEWKHTFVIGNGGAGKFPNQKAPKKDEACLFYVAVTRARENLYLSSVEIESEFVECAYGDVGSGNEIEEWNEPVED